jgi:hypothetical protein
MMREPSVAALLARYTVASFTFSYSAALLGRAYHPLGAYQTYATCVLVWLLAGFAITKPKRLWPPTKAESLSAVASVMILTAETIALMLPASVVAVVAGKAGCLAIPDRSDQRPWHRKYTLAALAACAVVLASVHKPLRILIAPLALAAIYVAGNVIKLKAVRTAKDSHEAKPGFLSAGQLVVCGLTLALSSAFSHFAPPAPLTDWRIWVVGGASLSAGLLGCRLMLHRTPQSVVYPAHRAASLVCSLGASAARGEALHWSGWAAVAIGLAVVLWAAAGPAALKFLDRLSAQVHFYILIRISVLTPREATLQPILRRALSS